MTVRPAAWYPLRSWLGRREGIVHVVLGPVGHFRSLTILQSFITRVTVEAEMASEAEV
jgi:hypothetical protein